jgi:hypothetical protein
VDGSHCITAVLRRSNRNFRASGLAPEEAEEVDGFHCITAVLRCSNRNFCASGLVHKEAEEVDGTYCITAVLRCSNCDFRACGLAHNPRLEAVAQNGTYRRPIDEDPTSGQDGVSKCYNNGSSTPVEYGRA